MQIIHLPRGASAATALEIPKGVTAVVGGGGKTTLLLRLARELSARGTVIVTTSTHIRPPEELPLLLSPTAEEIAAALLERRAVCIGTRCPDGKLADAGLPYETLKTFADYVLVEADGSKGLPLKANRGTEPVIPAAASLVVAVAGMDGVGKPIAAAACRPALYAGLVGAAEDETVTAAMAARVLTSPGGQWKGVPDGARFAVLLNKADTPERRRAAAETAALLDETKVERVIIGALLETSEGNNMLVCIRGAGDIASGVACRLHRSGFSVVMTDLPQPTSIRRTVCFSEAILFGTATVENIKARLASDPAAALAIVHAGEIAVLADPDGACIEALRPHAVVDAILAKRNLGTRMSDAPAVVGVGPGFAAGVDCHAVVETMRGHTLGRVYYEGAALPNTGVPGSIGGFTLERILRAPTDGTFRAVKHIGDTVEAGDVCAYVGETPVCSAIRGTLRGILPDGIAVHAGMKSGDVDPRCELSHCYTVSDKAWAVGGGVLEAILHFLPRREETHG